MPNIKCQIPEIEPPSETRSELMPGAKNGVAKGVAEAEWMANDVRALFRSGVIE